ncbi:MAG: NifB/NifX family molybdenum-iron cluster-binding protein [Prolixibacteraceae bacterium]|nr:NifB/NifX family molybdenum-iron cluster-binding protein [Prolixibacteraceae bacterium]MBN2774377.1 NifB/NifX family molybdenum-iron cluster-binding protein [Prolixibacteraceae bacterium]
MKTIITSTGNQLDSAFDLRFGRAAWYCIYNHGSKKTEFIKNDYSEANSGAGTKAAELMADIGATQIISGDFGPKAKSLLERMNIQMVIPNETNISIKELIEKLG